MPRPPAHSQKFYSSHISRLPEDLPLPLLPPITDQKLKQVATTHTSVYHVSKDTFDLDVDTYTEILDYEKLEFIGDKIISMCADLAVHELHPNMRQGMSSKLHDCLVQNETLAQLSERYKIIDMLKTSVSAGPLTKMQVKTKGSVFESYVAGVFYSFMASGAMTPSEKADIVEDGKTKSPTDTVGEDALLPTSSPEAGRSAGVDATKGKSVTATKAVHFLDVKSKKPRESPGNDTGSRRESSEDSDTDSESTVEEDGVSESGSNLLEILYAGSSDRKDQAEPPKTEIQAKMEESTMPNTTADPQRDSTVIVSPAGARKTEGQAFDHVYAWLKPLFSTMAEFFIQEMKKEFIRIQNDEAALREQALEKKLLDEQVAGGSTAALITYCDNYFGRQPEYEIVRSRPGIWKVTCTITGFDGEEYSGVGEKATKRMAKMVASYQVAVQLKLWK